MCWQPPHPRAQECLDNRELHASICHLLILRETEGVTFSRRMALHLFPIALDCFLQEELASVREPPVEPPTTPQPGSSSGSGHRRHGSGAAATPTAQTPSKRPFQAVTSATTTPVSSPARRTTSASSSGMLTATGSFGTSASSSSSATSALPRILRRRAAAHAFSGGGNAVLPVLQDIVRFVFHSLVEEDDVASPTTEQQAGELLSASITGSSHTTQQRVQQLLVATGRLLLSHGIWRWSSWLQLCRAFPQEQYDMVPATLRLSGDVSTLLAPQATRATAPAATAASASSSSVVVPPPLRKNVSAAELELHLLARSLNPDSILCAWLEAHLPTVWLEADYVLEALQATLDTFPALAFALTAVQLQLPPGHPHSVTSMSPTSGVFSSPDELSAGSSAGSSRPGTPDGGMLPSSTTAAAAAAPELGGAWSGGGGTLNLADMSAPSWQQVMWHLEDQQRLDWLLLFAVATSQADVVRLCHEYLVDGQRVGPARRSSSSNGNGGAVAPAPASMGAPSPLQLDRSSSPLSSVSDGLVRAVARIARRLLELSSATTVEMPVSTSMPAKRLLMQSVRSPG